MQSSRELGSEEGQKTIPGIVFPTDPMTVETWRKQARIEDVKTGEDVKAGPKEPRSTVLTQTEEAAIFTDRRDRLLPPDDCL